MAEHRPLGRILIESGRITEDDVERALRHQHEHGGYFGQALVTLGVLSRGELDWALASHFDLPFIFPQPEAVDAAAAALVTGEWALANMAVPIVQAGRSLTVVVASPLRADVLEELRRRTRLDINMGLAAADAVRDLIHSVYGDGDPPPPPEPRSCADFLIDAATSGAPEFGVSRRGDYAVGWWRTEGELRRVPLLPGWQDQLAATITPTPLEQPDAAGRAVQWPCTLRARRRSVALDAHALIGEAGAEYRFRPVQASGPPRIALPRRLAAELRLLAGSGACVALTAVAAARARALLPHLPAAVLGDEARAVHLTADGSSHGTEHAFVAPAPTEPGGYDALTAWRFDALTADLPLDHPAADWLCGTASLVIVFAERRDDERLAALGCRWLLHVPADPEAVGWTLRPLAR